MISLTFGLAGLGTEGGGSYMRLIYAPFYLMPDWSGYVVAGYTGGHSHGSIGDYEPVETTHMKVFGFLTEIEGNRFEKKFKIKYPLPKLNIINIEMRAVKVIFDEK